MTIKSVRFMFQPRGGFIFDRIRESLDCEKEGFEAVPVDGVLMIRQLNTGRVQSVPLSQCICDYGVVTADEEDPTEALSAEGLRLYKRTGKMPTRAMSRAKEG